MFLYEYSFLTFKTNIDFTAAVHILKKKDKLPDKTESVILPYMDKQKPTLDGMRNANDVIGMTYIFIYIHQLELINHPVT